jgi:putative RecB family exonuclease
MATSPGAYAVPTRLSPSRISDWRSCPLAYRLKHLDGLGKHEPPKAHLVKGNFVHSVLEALLAHPRDERTTQRAQEAFDETQRHYETSPRFRALGLDEVATADFWRHSRELINGYYRIENPRVPEVLGLELSLETSLGPFVLHGIIDRLERAPDGALVVSDYKTGKTPSPGYGAARMGNMHLYASLCHRERGELPARLRLYYLESSEIIEAQVTPETNARTEADALAVHAGIAAACASGEFPATTSGLCSVCFFKPWCPAFGGSPEAALTEIPLQYPVVPRD